MYFYFQGAGKNRADDRKGGEVKVFRSQPCLTDIIYYREQLHEFRSGRKPKFERNFWFLIWIGLGYSTSK